ncbi:MAG TPA: hypothetical protein VHV82_20775 [Sporichthyaceae bacterium]|jgi:hypothetical protein|nr:hypothetical protein [Sporichthyaceae bacterium]
MGRRPTVRGTARRALFGLVVSVTAMALSAEAHAAATGGRAEVVLAAEPTLRGANPVVGTPIRDTATLAGGFHPTGTITFTLYSDPGTCHVSVFHPAAVSVGTNGAATSPSYTPTAAGTYQWIAGYSGDANNNVVAGSCSDTRERVTIGPSGTTNPGTGGSCTRTSGNFGDGNSGVGNLGEGNQGDYNNGDGNEGSYNNGDGNEGRYNNGDCNEGSYNNGDNGSGRGFFD